MNVQLGSMPTLQEDDDTADVCPLVGKKLDQDEDEDVTDDEDDKDDGDEDEPEGHKDGSEKDDVERRDHGDGDIRLSGALLYCFIFSSLIAMFPHPTACPLQQSRHIKPQPLLLQHLTIQLQCIQACKYPNVFEHCNSRSNRSCNTSIHCTTYLFPSPGINFTSIHTPLLQYIQSASTFT